MKSPDYQDIVMDTRSSRAGPDGDVIKFQIRALTFQFCGARREWVCAFFIFVYLETFGVLSLVSARWSSEVEETGLRNNAKDFSAPEDERFRVDDTSQGNISFNNKAYLRKCH
ncbi:unnamed protein product [Brassica rapa subsp. narinosa]|uniref:Uncharacterized protein n=1 Tax=Brassica campestris TaxID=3711 RepID=M4CHD8_BRACM